VGGEVHHRIDPVLGQELRQQRMIADLADYELAGGDGLPEPLAQVVEHDDALARLAQLAHDMAANVAGTAGDQN
jgi:hypothetical protein